MEREKRKRADNGEVDGRRKKVRGGEEEEETAEEAAPPPTEDEVEEFFAILRRMHDAVKYFENGNGEGCKLKGRWRSALETETVEVVNANGVKDGRKRGGEKVEESRVLDLNAIPEGDSNSADL